MYVTLSPARRKVVEEVILWILILSSTIAILTTVGIVLSLLFESLRFFDSVPVADFLFGLEWSPQTAIRADQVGSSGSFGALPLLAGTLLISAIAMTVAAPLGLMAAIYLAEYASRHVRNIIKPVLEILAGIPTVVYGYFALVFVTPYVLKPIFQDILGFDVGVFNAASAGIVVGIMIIPMISSLSEDVLRSVPRSLREAAYALGSTRFDVSTRVVVPTALSGIIASFLLAISRAIGETMAVTIAAGQTAIVTADPLGSVATMTSYIVNVSKGDAVIGSIEEKSIYAVGLTLFLMTLVMNIISQFVLRRFREVYN